MFDYARSDTHFLLHIYDRLRNELLAKSETTGPNGNLINDVQDSSKAEALQRYERNFYDSQTGSGANGWKALLSRTSGTGSFNGEQFSVFRAVHEWRDKTARDKDESIHHILPNQALATIARELPTNSPALIKASSQGGPPSSTVRQSASNLLQIIGKAKAEGANGSGVKNLVKPHSHISKHPVDAAPSKGRAVLDVCPGVSQSLLDPEAISSTALAISDVSRFWGATIGGNGKKDTKPETKLRLEEPYLALPLPPLTAEIFETQVSDGITILPQAPIDPGARADHQYTKKRKTPEEDVFIVKQITGSKKRKMTEPPDGPEPVAMEDGVRGENGTVNRDAEQLEISLNDVDDGQEAREKKRRRQERKIQKRMLKEQKQQDEFHRTNGERGAEVQDGVIEAFDYENAPSVLHAHRGNDGRDRATKGFDPYTKSLHAPKGMRKAQREGPGRSITYQS